MVKPRNNLSLTHERLLDIIHYDPETGIFHPRKMRPGLRRSGCLGHVEKNGYRRIMLDRERYQANRLAWFYMTGKWPKFTIDHENLDRDDNAWKNLREATRAQQQFNQGAKGASGLKGAVWNRFRGYWQSYITIDGRSQFLGRFDTAEDAHEAFMAVARVAHGEFARAS